MVRQVLDGGNLFTTSFNLVVGKIQFFQNCWCELDFCRREIDYTTFALTFFCRLEIIWIRETISWNLSDTSINTNVTYAKLVNANLLQKRFFRSITSMIWKQKKTMKNVSSYFKMKGVHQLSIVKFLTCQQWRIYISKTVCPTAVYSS